jgi:hypothetical protein
MRSTRIERGGDDDSWLGWLEFASAPGATGVAQGAQRRWGMFKGILSRPAPPRQWLCAMESARLLPGAVVVHGGSPNEYLRIVKTAFSSSGNSTKARRRSANSGLTWNADGVRLAGTPSWAVSLDIGMIIFGISAALGLSSAGRVTNDDGSFQHGGDVGLFGGGMIP